MRPTRQEVEEPLKKNKIAVTDLTRCTINLLSGDAKRLRMENETPFILQAFPFSTRHLLYETPSGPAHDSDCPGSVDANDEDTSAFLRSSVPDRILQPRPLLTLRTKDDGTQEVTCRCTLQAFKDPDVLDLVRERKTKSPTLSTNGRAKILQLIASSRFVLTIGDVKSAFLRADKEEKPKDLSM